MNLSFDQELEGLLETVSFLSLTRYGDVFYTKKVTLKKERSISEFVWGFCFNPCFAKTLIVELKKRVSDAKKYLSTLARANKGFNIDLLYECWEGATKAAQQREKDESPIVYSMENSCVWTNQTMYINSVDGDMWCGVIFPKTNLKDIDTIRIRINGVDDCGNKWGEIEEWSKDEIVENTKSVFNHEFQEQDDWCIFMPYKHPVVLLNVDATTIHVTFKANFEEDYQEYVRPVYGICDGKFREWLGSNRIKVDLCNGSKFFIDTSNGTMTHA